MPRQLEMLGEIAVDRGWEIVVSDVMPGHAHLFVRAGTTKPPAEVVRAFKGRRPSPVLRSEFWWLSRPRVLSSTSYVAASVGCVAEETVGWYIEHLWVTA